ncbi:hypothetical protein D9M70_490550 [compost metagenome]
MGHGDHVVAEVQRGVVVVDIDLVVVEVAREHCRIESGFGGFDDFPDDHQLPRVDGARKHVGDQLADAVDPAELGPGSIDIGTHADIGVQRKVAIDQVIAAAAFDDVATGAAKDDVAGTEGGDARTEELLQASDQGDAFLGQHTAQRTVLRDLRGIGVVTPQDVAELRAG